MIRCRICAFGNKDSGRVSAPVWSGAATNLLPSGDVEDSEVQPLPSQRNLPRHTSECARARREGTTCLTFFAHLPCTPWHTRHAPAFLGTGDCCPFVASRRKERRRGCFHTNLLGIGFLLRYLDESQPPLTFAQPT